MTNKSIDPVGLFTSLGDKLKGFGADTRTRRIIENAVEVNPWFTAADIFSAVTAIREEMLSPEKFIPWINNYDPQGKQKNVLLYTAGNIPLVGFADILYVISAGHRCIIKPSSKDVPLTDFIIRTLKEISPQAPVDYYSGQIPDAVIATGSDNTNRYFRTMFRDIPSLMRGSRSSIALITDTDDTGHLRLLSNDIFMYSGLGCRNVSRLLLPLGYDLSKLTATFRNFTGINPKYINNYRDRHAVLTLNGDDFIDGGFYLLRKAGTFPAHISEITYTFYRSPGEAREYISNNREWIQCIVAADGMIDGSVLFGRSQRPALSDYPDNADVMDFLISVRNKNRPVRNHRGN